MTDEKVLTTFSVSEKRGLQGKKALSATRAEMETRDLVTAPTPTPEGSREREEIEPLRRKGARERLLRGKTQTPQGQDSGGRVGWHTSICDHCLQQRLAG